MTDLLSWLAGLGTFPKVLASIVVVIIALFILAVLWSPKPRATTSGQSSAPEVLTQGGSAEAPKSDITWNFDEGRPFFLGLVGGGGQETWVISFQATGRNNLDEPIRNVRGVVRSDVTNAEFPVSFVIDGVRVRPEDTYGIPRKADFLVASAPFPPPSPPRAGERTEGIPVSRFLIDFAEFTFTFEYDGKRFARHFSKEEVREQVAEFERASAPRRPAGVTRKPPQQP